MVALLPRIAALVLPLLTFHQQPDMMEVVNPSRETVLPLRCPPEQIQAATHLRGTVVATSFALARERGFERQYFEFLPSELHDEIRAVEPLSWVPMKKAVAHYDVMQRLFPTPEIQVQNGRLTSERTQNAYLKTLFKAAQATGQISPLVALKRLQSVFDRMLAGGGALATYVEGPKDGRIELYGYPILEVPYVRNGFQGMFESGISLTAKRVFVKLDRSFRGPDRAAYMVSWV